jgi:predicted TIM-barrel fold metal-dependent hydrolase
MTTAEQLAGRINDVDSHEQVPAPLWSEHFGDVVAPIAALLMKGSNTEVPQNTLATAMPRDDTPIEPGTVWSVKSARAPGAIDMRRRVDVLDFLGTRQSLIFPTGPGILGLIFALGQGQLVRRALQIEVDVDAETGRALCRAHNDWCIAVSQLDPRLRPVATLDPGTIVGAIAEAERVIAGGVRALMLPAGSPIESRSPAHPDLDPFWRVFTEADVPVMLHVGGEAGFLATLDWANAPQFHARKADSAELVLDPYTLSVNHFGAQNFLSTMVLGGVFERHPTLRFACIEVGAHWLGPCAENLDMWAEQFARRLAGQLSLRPSEYVARNVRVSAFYWEPVDRYIERFGLDSAYCYGSDYPHVESGFADPVPTWIERLDRLGPTAAEKFFVTNAELLFP